MYQEDKLFEVGRDSIVVKESDSFTKERYNKNGNVGFCFHEGETPYLTFPLFEQFPFIAHGFSTRLGGTSKGMFQTMNLSFQRGDEKDSVISNYNRICDSMGVHAEDIVYSDQVHDTKIQRVSKKETQGTDYGKRVLTGIDGMITNQDDVVLCTSYADCVPLFFVDAKHRAIASSHSGWKGTVGKIGAKTVTKMEEEFGTKPKDLYCVIGPSICVDCYEVSIDVVHEVQKNFQKDIVEKCVFPKGKDKYQLDLWMLNKEILMERGIPEEQIEVSNVCTCCNSSLLFSHRASGGKRGNLCGFLALVAPQ